VKLLALDTATEACSVALRLDGAVYSRWVEAPREHGDRLLAMIDEVLAEAGVAKGDLDALACGRGPGAFTGVRIAVSAVQGMAFGLDCPVVGVSDLAALAQGAWRRTGHRAVIAAIDARMGEVYWGAYRVGGDGVMGPLGEETVAPPEQVPWPETGDDWVGVGTGWARYPADLAARGGHDLAANLGRALPDATDIAALAVPAWARGEAVPGEQALPIYLRDRVADKPRQR
jgi:tRNA threonylcarbamoyladenosine biosynthesis protein TsaB